MFRSIIDCFVTVSAQYLRFGGLTWRSEVYGPCRLSSWNRIRHMRTAGHRQAACTKRKKPVLMIPSGRLFFIQKAMYLWQSYLKIMHARTQDPGLPTPDPGFGQHKAPRSNHPPGTGLYFQRLVVASPQEADVRS